MASGGAARFGGCAALYLLAGWAGQIELNADGAVDDGISAQPA